MVDFKLDYMARLFRSIRNKRFESYAIQRIWHQLNDDRIHFVTQQYFKRSDGKHALADLYLPQIGMVIEIDEEQHSKEENIELDKTREVEIRDAAGDRVVDFVRIPIYSDINNPLTLKDFNEKIDEQVKRISEKIKEKGASFEPWSGDDMLSPEYHINKGYLAVTDNDYVRNIDDAASIFKTKAVHRGWLRAAGFSVPNKIDYIVWLPAVNNKLWDNSISNDGRTIREFYNDKDNDKKRTAHLKEMINENKKRITFFRQKDALGFNFYKFVGVFEIDATESLKENKCVWKRISDKYSLS